MYIIGEKLNSSVHSTLVALRNEDFDTIDSFIDAQAAAGADCLDLNTALCINRETEYLKILASHVKERTTCDIMLDSPRPQVIIDTLPLLDGRYVILNSVTADNRIDELAPVAVEYNAGIVCMPIKSGVIPDTAAERLENVRYIHEKLSAMGIPDERMYFDALAEAIAMNTIVGPAMIETVELVRKEFPNVHILCGLSNVSFGLPKRAKINAAAITILVNAGMDCAIADALSPSLKEALFIANAITGKDEYCVEYIQHLRDTHQI